MMNMNSFKFPLILILSFGLSFWLAETATAPPKLSSIHIEVAPKGSAVTINGARAGVGKNAVQSGVNVIKVERSGFETQTKSIQVENGGRGFAGIILKPNTDKTNDWYETHPPDQKLVEAIGSHESDFKSDQVAQENTLLQLLPYSLAFQNTLVEIDAGRPQGDSDRPAIYINAPTPAARQAGVAWIRSKGYGPATMDLVFPIEVNFLKPEENDHEE